MLQEMPKQLKTERNIVQNSSQNLLSCNIQHINISNSQITTKQVAAWIMNHLVQQLSRW